MAISRRFIDTDNYGLTWGTCLTEKDGGKGFRFFQTTYTKSDQEGKENARTDFFGFEFRSDTLQDLCNHLCDNDPVDRTVDKLDKKDPNYHKPRF